MANADGPRLDNDLLKELEVVQQKSEFTADLQFAVAERWRRIELWLGIPAAGLAAIAGAAALASTAGRVPAGIVALVSAALGATLAFLNPSQRTLRASEAANDQRAIMARGHQLQFRYQQGTLPANEVIAEIGRLDEQRHEVNKRSDAPGGRLYAKTVERWNGAAFYRSYHPPSDRHRGNS
jgi:hypothetical protein